ncbi:cell division protein FtsQ/DivIB, partial [Angustibacter speluncae]
LLAALVVAAWVVLGSPWLRADEVRVDGAQRVQQAQVDSALGDQLGRPLARVDTGAVEERLEQLSQVRSAQVVRDWPSTLEVRLTERVPVAAVPGEAGFALVDDAGVVVETVPEPPAGLAVVSEETVAAGGEALEAAVAVLQTMPDDLRAAVAGTSAATPDSVTLALTSGAQVVWGSADESDRKAAVLRILLAQPAQVYDVSAPGTPVTR